MKKILVLVVMVALMASTVMAQDVTFSGEVEYGFLTDFSGDYVDEASDAVMTLKAAVDENNALTIKLEEDLFDHVGEQDGFFNIDQAYFVSDLDAALGTTDMGIGLALTSGLYESDWEDVGVVTGNEVEDVVGFANETWQFGLDLGVMDLVTIRTAVAPGDGLDGFLIGAFGGYGPVVFEVFYGAIDEAFEDGNIGVGVGYEMEVMPVLALAVGGEFGYDMGAADAGEPEWAYGVGVAADYNDGFVTAGLALNGEEETELYAMGFDLGVAPLANVGVDVAGAFIIDSDTSDARDTAVDFIEPSVWGRVGAAKMTLGYLYVPENAVNEYGSYNAKADGVPAGIDGGVFFQAQLSY